MPLLQEAALYLQIINLISPADPLLELAPLSQLSLGQLGSLDTARARAHRPPARRPSARSAVRLLSPP